METYTFYITARLLINQSLLSFYHPPHADGAFCGDGRIEWYAKEFAPIRRCASIKDDL